MLIGTDHPKVSVSRRPPVAWIGPVALSPALKIPRLVALFTALTIILTWPLASQAGEAVQDLGDPLYEIWNMRVVQHQLVSDPGDLWDGHILYPFSGTLLYSEPRLSTSLLAWPVMALTGNDVLSYNVMFWLSFVVMGLGVALLVDELSGSQGAGLLAGVAAAFTPYRFGHISHLNLLSFGWLPLALWALLRYTRNRRPRDAILGGAFLTIQLLASDTLAALSLGVLGLVLPFLLWSACGRITGRFLAGLAASLLVPVLVLAPVAAGRFELNRRYGFSRDLTSVRELASTPSSYISVSPFNQLWRGMLPELYPSPLFPGALVVLGIALGLGLALRERPRWSLFAVVLILSGGILSLGPETTIAGFRLPLPYRALYDHLPGFSTMRDPARFGMVALLGMQLLAGLGLAAGWRVVSGRLSSRWRSRLGALLLIGLTFGAVAESRSEVGTVEVPRDPETLAVYRWLAEQPPGAVIEFPANGIWTDVTQTTRQMYYLSYHWHPIVAGYTSFYPPRYLEFLTRVHGSAESMRASGRQLSEVSRANVGLLQDIGVRYVIIHRAPGYDWRHALEQAAVVPDLILRGEYGDALAFELQPGERKPLTFDFAAPAMAAAGHELVASLKVVNENRTSAAADLIEVPVVDARWLDETGRTVATQRVALDVAVVDPGLTAVPVRLQVPERAGRYRLLLSYAGHADAAEFPVEVIEPDLPGGGPALSLRAVRWPQADYRPGGAIDLTLEWRVDRPLERSYTVSVQLLGPDGRLHSQWDGLPFAGDHPTTEWRPGSRLALPVWLAIDDDAPPGHYQILVVLYDGALPGLPRLPLAQPDGSVAEAGLFGPIQVSAR